MINKARDLCIRSRLEHLPELLAKARQANDRLLMIERAGQGCAIGSPLFERIHQPYVREANEPVRSSSAIHAPWPMAGALCLMVHAVNCFTNESLRGFAAGHPSPACTLQPPLRVSSPAADWV